jgi:hypothetical protein
MFSALHIVTSQTAVFFLITSVKTQNFTLIFLSVIFKWFDVQWKLFYASGAGKLQDYGLQFISRDT